MSDLGLCRQQCELVLWQQAPDVLVEADHVFALMNGRCCQPGIGNIVGGQGLIRAQGAQLPPLIAQRGMLNVGRLQQASMNRNASPVRSRICTSTVAPARANQVVANAMMYDNAR